MFISLTVQIIGQTGCLHNLPTVPLNDSLDELINDGNASTCADIALYVS